MAYIGAEPVPGQNREVDDISSGFNGNATAFTLQVSSVNVSPESANNILINLGGVLQNPGTDYTIAASTITFTTAPAAGLSFFGLILGAGINTATVADDTIGASKLIDTAVTAGSYTTADITVDAQGRITAAASGTISGAEIADQAVTNAKVNNSAAIARTKLANVDVVDDTSPQLGGNLDANSNSIAFGDSNNDATSSGNLNRLKFGAGTDMVLYHNGTDNFLKNPNGTFKLFTGADKQSLLAVPDGEVSLHHNDSKKFFTISNGVQATNRIIVGESTNQRGLISGDQNGVSVGSISDIPLTLLQNSLAKCRVNGNDFQILNDSGKLELGASQDFAISHNGSTNVIDGLYHPIELRHQSEVHIKCVDDGAVELYFNNSKKLKTINEGIKLTELQIAPSGTETSSLMTFGGGGVVTNSNSYGHFYDRATAGGNTLAMRFRSASGSTTVGQISFNNSATIYTTSSDYRLKENAVSISDGINRLKTLKPYRFNFKGESDIVDGFFAHEVTAVPEAVTGTKDEVVTQAMIDAKGYEVGALNSPIYQGIDQSKLVPLLTAALQEAVSKIETLETKVAALEAA